MAIRRPFTFADDGLPQQAQPGDSLAIPGGIVGSGGDKWIAGRWYADSGRLAISGGTYATANQLGAVRIILPVKTRIASIGLVVSTLASGGLARIGLWTDSGTLYPGALLFDAEVSTATTGAKTATVNMDLDPGDYWIGGMQSAAATLQVVTRASVDFGLGWPSPLTNPAGASAKSGYQQSATYGALPTFSAGLAPASPFQFVFFQPG